MGAVIAGIVPLSMLSLDEGSILAGCLPAWKASDYNVGRLAPLTDKLTLSIQIGADGLPIQKDVDPSDLPKLTEAKKRFGLRLLICVSRWERSSGFYPSASDPSKRARRVGESNRSCQESGFDGVDSDWEHLMNESDAATYGSLIAKNNSRFRPSSQTVTADIARWQAKVIAAVTSLERVHLMRYDLRDRHSTLERAKLETESHHKMGFSSARVVLRQPLHGRKPSNWADSRSHDVISTGYNLSNAGNGAGGSLINGVWLVAVHSVGTGSLLKALRRNLVRG